MSTVEVTYEIDGGFRFFCACEYKHCEPRHWEEVVFVSVEGCAYLAYSLRGPRWVAVTACPAMRQAFYELLNDGGHVDRIIDLANQKLEDYYARGLHRERT